MPASRWILAGGERPSRPLGCDPSFGPSAQSLERHVPRVACNQPSDCIPHSPLRRRCSHDRRYRKSSLNITIGSAASSERAHNKTNLRTGQLRQTSSAPTASHQNYDKMTLEETTSCCYIYLSTESFPVPLCICPCPLSR